MLIKFNFWASWIWLNKQQSFHKFSWKQPNLIMEKYTHNVNPIPFTSEQIFLSIICILLQIYEAAMATTLGSGE